ncbi:uncharacterized protein L203_104715 [Cryptococcus depauperatus CBS 7841]|uniref:Homeobox domain-containing protein n=1 Tax=Cryptococcus depauperatus CBS 7841 TaxID=1295531 RepID=A0AAJ8M2H1_9TREE
MDTSHTLAPADMSATTSATTSHLAPEPGQRPLPPPPFVAGGYPPPPFPDPYAAPGYDYGAAAPSWLPPTDLADVRTELLDVGPMGAAGAQVKHRRRTTPEQLKVLEFWYELHPKPDNELRERLAAQLGMTKRNVQAGQDEGARAEGGGGAAGRGVRGADVRRGGLRARAAGQHRQRRGGAARQHPVPGVRRPDVAGDAGGAVGAAHGGAPQRAPPVGAQPGPGAQLGAADGADAAHAAAVERAVHAAAGRLEPAPGGRRARRERARDDWRRRGAAVCRLAPRARRLPLSLAAAEPVVLVWLAAGRAVAAAAGRAVHDDAGPRTARQPRVVAGCAGRVRPRPPAGVCVSATRAASADDGSPADLLRQIGLIGLGMPATKASPVRPSPLNTHFTPHAHVHAPASAPLPHTFTLHGAGPYPVAASPYPPPAFPPDWPVSHMLPGQPADCLGAGCHASPYPLDGERRDSVGEWHVPLGDAREGEHRGGRAMGEDVAYDAVNVLG